MTTTGDTGTDGPGPVAAVGGWPLLLATLIDGRDLTTEQALAAMTEILSGVVSEPKIAGLLVALQAKGESTEELIGFATGMREAAQGFRVDPDATDIVGTGGSPHRRRHALNVSTMASIVAAGAGAIICKHGNRKASSTSGSFDFLEALGVAIDLGPEQMEACVGEAGVGFAFARNFHPAMRFAGPVRVELGVPTTFNLLGPLAHPGLVRRQVIGVSSEARAAQMADVLAALGTTSAWVVAGADGLDELSTTGDSVVFAVDADGVRRQEVRPVDLGIERTAIDDLAGGDAGVNAEIFHRMLDGERGPYRDIVQLNAAAGLVVAGRVDRLEAGFDAAGAAIDDGRAAGTLERLREVTNRLVAG